MTHKKLRVKMSNLNEDLQFSIEFVKEIERYPCIYNNKHGEYYDKTSIEKAWRKVGERFSQLTAPELRLKWRSVRSSYSRSHRLKKDYYLAPYLTYLLPYTRIKCKDNSVDDVKTQCDSESHDDSDSQSDDDVIELEPEPTKHEQDLEQDKDDNCTEYNGKIQVKTLPELSSAYNNRKEVKTKVAQSKILLSSHSQYTTSRLSPHECYLKSLLPDISSMDERQFFKFRIGLLNIIGKIKYSKNPPDTESST